MKRLLMITNYFRPEPGGLEALFTSIACKWPAERIEVAVTVGWQNYLTSPFQRAKLASQEDYSIHRPLHIPSNFSLNGKNGHLKNFFEQRFELFKPQHLIFSDANSLFRQLGARAADLGIPYSIFLHGRNLYRYSEGRRFFYRRFIRQATNFFALSQYLADSACQTGLSEEKITVLPPGFEPRWQKQNRKLVLSDELQKRIGNRFLLLGVGPLMPRKGFEKAIMLLANNMQLKQQAHLVLVGSGPEYSYLQELIQARRLENEVTMTGLINEETLAALFRWADIFVQPGSHREDDVQSLGHVFMEAAWFGLPVIAGRMGGVEEIIRHGVNGFVIQPGNLSELNSAILRLLFSRQLRLQLGKNARELARQFDARHTFAVFCKQLENS